MVSKQSTFEKLIPIRMIGNQMKRKRKSGTKRRTNNSLKRVHQDLRSFKNKLKRLVDATKLVWDGPPYKENSIYRFELNEDLVQFVVQAAIIHRENQGAKAQEATLKMAESIRLATLPDPEGEITKLDDETEAAFEKFLTVSESDGTIDLDDDGVKTVTE